MKNIIRSLIITTFWMGTLDFAEAQTASTPTKSKTAGGPSEDHMKAMMDTCMTMYKDEANCKQQMKTCRKNMSGPDCEKIHRQMK